MKHIAWMTLALVSATCGAAYGQTFEVASIRAAAPPEMQKGGGMIFRMGRSGGPGTKDPTRATYENTSLAGLLIEAYDIKRYQLTGPAFLDSERFDVKVKVPEGATKEEFKVMLQNLLTERFKVTLHREKKEMPLYELVVAKNGPKLKESKEESKDAQPEVNPEELARTRLEAALKGATGPGGGPGPNRTMFNSNGGQATMKSDRITMQDFATRLSNMVNRPVTDGTGLTAKYDITLTFSPQAGGMMPAGMGAGGGMIVMQHTMSGDAGGGPGPAAAPDPDSGPTIFSAIQDQLGLKLEGKKGPVDTIVIDHMEKAPTEN